MPAKIDYTGQRFGRLTVIREGPRKYTSGGHSKVVWVCVCDCNPDKEILIDAASLRNGHTKSCGCYNKEKARYSKFKQRCTYDLSGEYGIGYTANGDEFWFDKEDYDLIKNFNWNKHNNYFVAHVPMEKPRRSITLHRLIMGIADTKYDYTYDVDHIITENKYDNRKCNLRIATKQENNRNKIKQKNNKSGVPGVHRHYNGWRAEIYLNKRRIQKDFKNFEDAVAWRKEMEKLYYGDFSYSASQNLLKERIS